MTEVFGIGPVVAAIVLAGGVVRLVASPGWRSSVQLPHDDLHSPGVGFLLALALVPAFIVEPRGSLVTVLLRDDDGRDDRYHSDESQGDGADGGPIRGGHGSGRYSGEPVLGQNTHHLPGRVLAASMLRAYSHGWGGG